MEGWEELYAMIIVSGNTNRQTGCKIIIEVDFHFYNENVSRLNHS